MQNSFSAFLNHHKFKLLLFFVYDAIYFPWFSLLEKKITADSAFTAMYVPLDDFIPFVEIFIVPYLIWYAFVTVTVFSFMFLMPEDDFYRLAAVLMTGMIITFLIYTFFPNGQLLRPEVMPRDNIFCRLVEHIYRKDTPTNVFPSIHCLNSFASLIAILHAEKLKEKKFIRILSIVITLLIILSTVFIKQHSVLDILGAAVLSAILYIIFYGKLFPKSEGAS